MIEYTIIFCLTKGLAYRNGTLVTNFSSRCRTLQITVTREETFHWSCLLQCHIFFYFFLGTCRILCTNILICFCNWNTFAVDYQEDWNCHLVSTLYFCTYSLESKIMRIYASHIHNSQKMLIPKNSNHLAIKINYLCKNI